MSLFRCDEIGSGSAAGFSVKGFVRKYTRTFRLWGTDMTDGPITLIDEAQALGIFPTLFSAYVGANGEFDTGARLVDFNPRRHENPFWWIVECEYSSQLDDVFRQNTPEMARDAQAGNNDQYQDPFAQPPSIEWDGVDWNRAMDQSLVIASGSNLILSGNPGGYGPTAVEATPDTWTPSSADIGLGVVDSTGHISIIIGVLGSTSWVLSGDPTAGKWWLGGDPAFDSTGTRFDPAPEVQDSLATLSITRNELAFDPSIAQQYANLVNSDPFYGALPGQAKMRRPHGVSAFENGIYYWKVTYKIDFRAFAQGAPNLGAVAAWRTVVVDCGYRMLNLKTSPPVPINIPDSIRGDNAAGPVLLDGTGQPLGSANSVTGAIAQAYRKPFYRQFCGYRTGPFGPLGLPFNVPQH